MDKIAIISDIHGNLQALDAVVRDIRSRRIERIICLGDLVGKGPQPCEAVDWIRELCEVTVQGNWDHGINLPQQKESGLWQQKRLGTERLRYLLELPFFADLRMSGRRIRLLHASSRSVYHRVLRKANKKEKLAMFENTEHTGGFLQTELTPDVIGYGDIHVPFLQTLKSEQIKGLLLFNTGSVGAPYDGLTQASYTILEGTADGNEEAPFSVQSVRVPYDIEQAIAVAQQVGIPELERFRYEQRTGLEQ
ncbi:MULTISPECIES: metallophosphoesterase family protein [unclassified Paenibacillus]|uniref:metallophosphoesterase family protein n=1 Tax=unclassified Paenibacillus TaxID=185978 RepID=UPI001AE40133|nr:MULTISPECIES: metallophosphoesterase family protein [unclassified Paenibacillus]MBP1154731.1 protein phosphatase [Paenibacillus sp. PvP091]MBP1169885.1 protein phosphatase [Paenibacillus sp. PvR098]MBP2440913.1 protein phosphatase [Paenibacillus sp. PvP052]